MLKKVFLEIRIPIFSEFFIIDENSGEYRFESNNKKKIFVQEKKSRNFTKFMNSSSFDVGYTWIHFLPEKKGTKWLIFLALEIYEKLLGKSEDLKMLFLW